MNLNVSSINSGFIILQGLVCNIYEVNDCNFDFVDNKIWSNVLFKVGVCFCLDDDINLFVNWLRGFCFGGYNLWNIVDISMFEFCEVNGLGLFDEEIVDNFEVGYKGDIDWGCFNVVVFIMNIDDMQCEVSLFVFDGLLI